MDRLKKLAPFLLRTKALVPGREQLKQMRNRLAFVLITTDISANSQREILFMCRCPVVQVLTMEDIETLFGFRGCKVLGFRRSSLTGQVLQSLKEYRVQQTQAPSEESQQTNC